MYRKPHATGPLRGVEGGPYTGPSRWVDLGRLPPASRERLVSALRGTGAAHAIVRPDPGRWIVGSRVAAGLGLLVLAWAWMRPLGDGTQGTIWLVAYLAAASALALGLTAEVRRRRAGPIPDGAYLLPLDLVDVHGTTLRVTPNGSLRDADFGAAPLGGTRLEIRDADGNEHHLPIPRGTDDTVHKLLEHAQATLQRLTYGDDLDDAIKYDPFFEVRHEGEEAWRAVETTKRPAPASRAWAIAALAMGATLGGGAWHAHNRACVAESKARLEESARPPAHERVPPAPTARGEVANDPGSPIPTASGPAYAAGIARCKEAFAARAPNERSRRAMAALLEGATLPGSARIDVVFAHALDASLPGEVGPAAIEQRERVTARALAIVLSEVCPASVLRVETNAGSGSDPPARLTIGTQARATRYAGEGADAAADMMGLTFVFHAELRVKGAEPVAIVLTMPPPERLSAEARTRSLFRIDPDQPWEARVYKAQTARAFDRLYDELYGTLLAGDPRVPLRDADEALKAFSPSPSAR